MGLPPLMACFVCHQEVNDKSQYALRRVRAWVRIGRKTVYQIIDEEPVFAHEHCLGNSPDDSPTLF